MVRLKLLQFVLTGFELVLDGPELPLRDFGIAAPLLDLSAQL